MTNPYRIESRVLPQGVLHIIDTLEIGGAERMAVNLVNQLPRDRFKAHLCTTRHEGPLARDIDKAIPRLQLRRRGRFDPVAIRKLVEYVRLNDIRILHAHGSSLFLARAAAAIGPRVRVIWHNHYGFLEREDRQAWTYRVGVHGIAAVISVNTGLADWARTRLRVPADRVWQLNNFSVSTSAAEARVSLPGIQSLRVVCVANLRPLKGHRDLLLAIASVAKRIPGVRLFLVGTTEDARYRALLEADVCRLGLLGVVSFLGARQDVGSILGQCSVGVLSSHHEGLPVSLLEYGNARLAVVATDVGECAKVLADGDCGFIVGSGQPSALASAIERLLSDEDLRAQLGARFQKRVRECYSEHETVRKLCQIYESALGHSDELPRHYSRVSA